MMTKLRGLGEKTCERLRLIGIESLEEMQALGVVETYLLLKAAFPEKVSLNALWALEGALNDRDWREIPAERKAELRRLVGR